ncbi:hypothetical protein [Pigmentiphaga kullae]|uniref:Lipoprotein n=1 Tax=Pigmentiphaga kullae TaxID=151784 RepID=A0A4Q7NA62_9BURK|nr:hypothetical protein [Pigmentiphaga kullae]RZS78947.1 hypothetical protein EV675_5604 [Pigmentiphaga kullae]
MRPPLNTPAVRVRAPRVAAARLAVLLAAALPILPACAHDARQAPAATATGANAFVAHPGKPGDLVAVSVRAPAAPLATGPTSVGLSLRGSPGVTQVELKYGVEGALRVDAASPTVVPLDAQRRAVVEVPLTVLGTGVHYLNVYVTANGRHSALSVRVDAGQASTLNRKQSAPDQGGFVVLPAQETRSGGTAR